MSTMSLTFDAVEEARPGKKWLARWRRSWPAYESWFLGRNGDSGPSRSECEAALARYMPELAPVHKALTRLTGNSDRAARFLSTWCPPQYLGGCTLAALASEGEVRLVRNYDLSPQLNEGLLLCTEWTGTRVMGMVEFLWGLSDGVNDRGLSVALAYGGRSETGEGFGVTTILRYVMETCGSVAEAINVFRRVPSHMAYNITLADRTGETATVELQPGGGVLLRDVAIATNHQHEKLTDRPGFTRTMERRAFLESLYDKRTTPFDLAPAFLQSPLYQTRYGEGFGTLFTAEYDPANGALRLLWKESDWQQSLASFEEGSRLISYNASTANSERSDDATEAFRNSLALFSEYLPEDIQRMLGKFGEGHSASNMDWTAFGDSFTAHVAESRTAGFKRPEWQRVQF